MQDRKNQKDLRPISLEEQHKEAVKDGTGKIRRYLDLAEKLLQAGNNLSADAA